MAITIKAPDGSSIQFPDGTPEATITDVMRKNFPPTSAADTSQPSILDRVVASPLGRFAQENVVAPAIGLGTMLSHAVTSDPRVDTIQNAETGGYEAALARNRNTPGYAEALQQAQAAQGGMSADAEAFMPSVQSTIAGTVGLTGGLDTSNAMADVASQRQDAYRQAHPKTAFAQSLVGGLAAGPEGGAKTISAAAAPTVTELKAASKAAYDTVKSSGLEVSASPVRTMVQDVITKLADEGFDPVLHPNTARSLARLQDIAAGPKAANTIPLTQLETERKVAGQAAKAAITNPSDAHMAGIIQDHIDSLAENLQPQDIVSGDPKALQALPQARQAWRTAKKAEIISDAFERAQNASQYTQSGYENALRTSFRSIANNKKRMGAFSPDEQAAITKVVRGGSLENSLRWIGKLAPRGVVSAMGDLALGHATGVGVGPFMVAGEGAKMAATRATLGNAERASQLVRNGGNAAAIGPQLAPQLPRSAAALPYGSLSALLDQLSQQQQKQYGLVPAY